MDDESEEGKGGMASVAFIKADVSLAELSSSGLLHVVS